MFEKEIIMTTISKQVSNILKYNEVLRLKSHTKPCNYHWGENKGHVYCKSGYFRAWSCFLTWAPIKGGFVTFPPHTMTLFTYIFTMQCKIDLILGSFKSLVNKLFIPEGKKNKNVSANYYGSLSIISQGWKMW